LVATRRSEGVAVNLLLWGLVLPILLVVAGIVVILRKRNDRR
jgi:hypothetical protein